VIVGAIGDYGTATSLDQNGTVDAQGGYVKIALKKGGFEINSVAFNKAVSSTQPVINNSTNCSVEEVGSGTVTVFDGTGAYAGISGTLHVTGTFAGIGSRLKSGKCNESQSAQPVAIFGTITGSGTVSFSLRRPQGLTARHRFRDHLRNFSKAAHLSLKLGE
jgi:hypothetical protein